MASRVSDRVPSSAEPRKACFVQATLGPQSLDALPAQPVKLVDGPQRRQTLHRIGHAPCVKQAVKQLPVRDPQLRLTLRKSRRLQPLAGHGDDFGVGFGSVGADGVGVALDELAEPPRAGFFVSPHGSEGIAAIGLGQGLPGLGGEPGQGRGQVVAQRHPLIVIVGQGKDALVRTVGVGQELAQSVGIFECARLQRLEAPALIDLGHPLDQPALGDQVTAASVGEPTRIAGFGAGGGGGICGHAAVFRGTRD